MKQLIFCFSLTLFLSSCMTLIPQREANFDTSSVAIKDIQLAKDVNCQLPTGQTHLLLQGSRWQPYGRTDEGTVYKPTDHILTIADREEYTAYLVISGSEIVGFFLPEERAFAPLIASQQVEIK